MPAAYLRLLALTWFSYCGLAQAQDIDSASAISASPAGAIYEQSRQDVTLPIERDNGAATNGAADVTVPVESLATPMRCMTAWSYLAGRVIRDPEAMREQHPDFTEATASAHWQHWLKLDLDAHQGTLSADFHPRRLAAERAFSLALAAQEEPYAYRTLGMCYIPPIERQLADPTLLLRNFMVDYQGLPDSFKIPVLQRQLRAFPISESIDAEGGQNCDETSESLREQARQNALSACFARGGILASQVKTAVEDLDGLCRVTSALQCENIP